MLKRYYLSLYNSYGSGTAVRPTGTPNTVLRDVGSLYHFVPAVPDPLPERWHACVHLVVVYLVLPSQR